MKTIITQKNLPTSAIIRLVRTTSVITALIFTFLALPVQAQPSITASQNPVLIPAGQTSGAVTLTWDGGGDHPYAELWQQVDNNDETFVVEQGKGTRQMTVEIGKTYIFKLSDAGTLLASVTVTAINEQPKPPGGGGGNMPPGRVPGTNMVANITDDKASPRGSAVEVTFWTLPRITPTVEIGKVAPVQANGSWVFPAGQSVGQGSAVASQKTGPLSKKVGVKANTFYKFDSTQANVPALDPGAAHYYIISVPRQDGAGYYQTTGNFATLSQTVKVVFEKIRIIDDSDDLSPAELLYWCWVNYGHPTRVGFNRGRLSMSTGETYDINKEFFIQNAPKTLSLSVSAEDNDNTFDGGLPAKRVPPPLPTYQNAGVFDQNVAKDEWDLSRFPTAPGETYRQVFKLESIDGGELRFEVYGYWEITRSN